MDEKKLLERASKIRLLILDVDGVMTDGRIILDNEGNEYKSFHVRDGHGIKLLIRNGIDVAIITGRESGAVARRARELGIENVYQKCYNKVLAYEELKTNMGLEDYEVAFVGDDIVDIPVLKRVGLPVVVADADGETKKHAVYVTRQSGGRGAVREVAEMILQAKSLWEKIVDEYNKT